MPRKLRIETVDPRMAAVLRAKTPAERLRIGFALWAASVRMVRSHLRASRPGLGSEDLEREVARRMSLGS